MEVSVLWEAPRFNRLEAITSQGWAERLVTTMDRMRVSPLGVSPLGVNRPRVSPLGASQLGVNRPGASPLEVSPLGVSPLEVSPLGVSPLEVSPLEVSPLEVSPLEVNRPRVSDHPKREPGVRLTRNNGHHYWLRLAALIFVKLIDTV